MERILAISTLFPTPEMQHHGLFVKNRLQAMAKNDSVEVVVCNPIPTSLLHKIMPRYKKQQSAPLSRQDGDLLVFHPRYHSLPGFKKDEEHLALHKGIASFLQAEHLKKNFTRIDVHWAFPDLPVAIALAERWRIPCSLTLRGMETFYTEDNDERSNIIFEAMTKLDSLISLSQEMLTFAHHKQNGIPAGVVVTNGADTNRFHYIEMHKAREELSLDYRGDILLGVGALVERKGFHHVIDAVINLNEGIRQHNPVHYYILGKAGMEGDFEKSLREKIAAYEDRTGRVGEIRLLGNVDNSRLGLWYNAATIFCLSSFGEGSPNVLTEALSCGTKAICTNVGAVPDIMSRGNNTGTLISNKKGCEDAVFEWASAIKMTLENPTLNDGRAQQALDMKKFSWEWCANEALRAIGVKGIQ